MGTARVFLRVAPAMSTSDLNLLPVLLAIYETFIAISLLE